MEMNRGRIGMSSSTGHVHALGDLADVESTISTDPPTSDSVLFYSVHSKQWEESELPILSELISPYLPTITYQEENVGVQLVGQNFDRQPVDGDVIMFVDGAWRLVTIERLLGVIRDTN
jgi:hypothetical protein